MAVLEFVPIEDNEKELLDRKIIVTCDYCGNTTETSHFWCGTFLPISTYCVVCRKYRPAHARYAE